ncbi:MAG: helix-turn-helix domain-containing protein [candidate division NC10 bacterium]|nr:helix-turn-helix domain-containing protein [candidate division NC10 bacterium]
MMRCLDCGTRMRAHRNRTIPYPESGIPNLWLKGITVYRCRRCAAELPEIPNSRRLHRGIADWLAQEPRPLSGPEFRFLRKQMGLRAQDLAEIVGVQRESVTRWETGAEPIGPPSDRLIRLVYGVWCIDETAPLPPHLQRIRDALRSIARKRHRPAKLVLSPAALAVR